MAKDGERGARNRAEIQKSISNLIALGGEDQRKEEKKCKVENSTSLLLKKAVLCFNPYT